MLLPIKNINQLKLGEEIFSKEEFTVKPEKGGKGSITFPKATKLRINYRTSEEIFVTVRESNINCSLSPKDILDKFVLIKYLYTEYKNKNIENISSLLTALSSKEKYKKEKVEDEGEAKLLALKHLWNLLNMSVKESLINKVVTFNQLQDIWFTSVLNTKKENKNNAIIDLSPNIMRVYLCTLFACAPYPEEFEKETGWTCSKVLKENVSKDMADLILMVVSSKNELK